MGIMKGKNKTKVTRHIFEAEWGEECYIGIHLHLVMEIGIGIGKGKGK